MKIRSNKISDMCEFYRITLTGLYEVSEVDELIFMAFEHVLKYTREQFSLSKNDNLNLFRYLHSERKNQNRSQKTHS